MKRWTSLLVTTLVLGQVTDINSSLRVRDFRTGPNFMLLSVDQATGIDVGGCGTTFPCKSPNFAFAQLPKIVQALERVQLDAGNYYGPPNLIDNVVTASHLEKGLPGTFSLTSYLPDLSVGLIMGTGYGPEYPTDGGSAVTTLDTSSIMPKVLIEGAPLGSPGTIVAGPFAATSGTDVASLITITQAGAGWTPGQFAGMFVKILSGSGFNPQSISPAADTNIWPIDANSATVLTLSDVATQPMQAPPDSTTQYEIVQPSTILHPETMLADGGIGQDGPQETLSISNVGGMGASNSIAGFNQNTSSTLEVRYVRVVQSTPGGHAAVGVHTANVRFWGCQFQSTAVNNQGVLAADNSYIELIRSTVVQTAGGSARGAVDLQGVKFGAVFDGVFISGVGNGLEIEGGSSQINVLSSYILGGSAAAILLIGPQYVRIASLGNAYATSTSGAALQVQRGAIARIGNGFANASGNSGTWGVNCGPGPGAIYTSTNTSATGATGNATANGADSSPVTTSYATINASNPPLVFTNGCYVGKQ
jgi:hypothetical protein